MPATDSWTSTYWALVRATADEEHFRFSSLRTAGGVAGTASYAIAECRDGDFFGRRFAMITVAESESFTVYGRGAAVVAEYARAQEVPMKTS